MRVLVTDYTWPSLDVERAVLAEVGAELVIAESGDVTELVRLGRDVDAILTCFAKVSAEVLDAAPRCLTVARYGVGLDNIDVEHATRLGMVVSNVADYCMEEVADSALAGILALARRQLPLTRDVAAGGWGEKCRHRGAAARQGARVGRPRRDRASSGAPRASDRSRRGGADAVGWCRAGVRAVGSLDERLTQADVLSLHVPLTDKTRGMIGAPQLAAMKPTAWLVNTARGPLVNTVALVNALERGALGGAVLDVTEPEPLPADHPLRTRDDVVLTPHTAFASDGSLAELASRAATNVADVLRGRLPSAVANPQVLDSPALRIRLEDR